MCNLCAKKLSTLVDILRTGDKNNFAQFFLRHGVDSETHTDQRKPTLRDTVTTDVQTVHSNLTQFVRKYLSLHQSINQSINQNTFICRHMSQTSQRRIIFCQYSTEFPATEMHLVAPTFLRSSDSVVEELLIFVFRAKVCRKTLASRIRLQTIF